MLIIDQGNKGAAIELGRRRLGGQAFIKDQCAAAVNQVQLGAGHPVSRFEVESSVNCWSTDTRDRKDIVTSRFARN